MSKQGTVTFVLGLAGSGKSYYVEQNLITTGVRPEDVFDEMFAYPTLHVQNHQRLVQRLNDGAHCVVSELQYLCPVVRDKYVQKLSNDTTVSPEIRWVCFANDLDTANHNCRVRPPKAHDPSGEGHITQNELWTGHYELPESVSATQIYRLPS